MLKKVLNLHVQGSVFGKKEKTPSRKSSSLGRLQDDGDDDDNVLNLTDKIKCIINTAFIARD